MSFIENSELTVIPSNRGDDIHNIEFMDNADLILFMAGNQFMVMDELLAEFKIQNPSINKIFYETLPPGLELKQILSEGAKFGNTKLTGRPDIYTSVTEESMRELKTQGRIIEYFIYLHNRIVLMVQEGNPAGINGIFDLQKEDIRISQPGSMEDITNYIDEMYLQEGGEKFANRIMEEKRAEGTTIFTVVHHRETPMRIIKNRVDVGPVWATEVVEAKKKGLKIDALDLGPALDQHDKVNYYVTRLSDAPNPENAEIFLDFIRSNKAQAIYKSYGFVPHF